MVTSNRKASPAQIAARKLFAERAKAGTLGKPKRRTKTEANAVHVSPGRGVEAALRIAKKIKDRLTRKKNPTTERDSRYVIYKGNLGKVFAVDLTRASALSIAKHQHEMTGERFFVEHGVSGANIYDSKYVKTDRKKNPIGQETRMTNPRMRQTMQGASDNIKRMTNPIRKKVRIADVAQRSRAAGSPLSVVYIIEVSKDKRYWQFIGVRASLKYAKEKAEQVASDHPNLAVRVKSEKVDE